MKPFSRSIIELFDGKKRYLIPLFQRQYVWKEEPQLARIWEDVRKKVDQRVSRKSTFPHFLGAIVIAQIKTFGKQVQAFDVIDGQQRLSTFQILLCSFRDVASGLGSEFAAELDKYIKNDGVMEDKNVERYKLWPTQVDRSQLKALVDEGTIEKVQAREKNDFNLKKTGVSPNMIGAYKFFHQKISELLSDPTIEWPIEERVEALFSTLKNDLALVSIELEGGDDPQVIFETLNGFGQPLLPTDLMRNYVFQIAYRENRSEQLDREADEHENSAEALYEKYWLPLDQPFWKKTEKQGRINRPRVDNFFMHFLAMKKANDVNVGRLFHEFRHWLETEKPYSHVEELLKDTLSFANIYQGLAQPSEGDEFFEFTKVLHAFDVSTIIPLVLHLAGEAKLAKEQLKECLNMLESFLVRRAICGLTNKNYNRLFIQLVEQIRGASDPVEALGLALSKPGADVVTAVWPDDQMFRSSWESRPIYTEMPSARIQFVLTRIEAAMRTAKNEDFSLKSALSVEHIMPIKWWENWPLKDGRRSEEPLLRELDELPDLEANARDRAVHTIGNLTLLTQALNSSVSNGPWQEKKTEILKHSALAISRMLLDTEQWSEVAMAERSRLLFSYASKIWGAPKPKKTSDSVDCISIAAG